MLFELCLRTGPLGGPNEGPKQLGIRPSHGFGHVIQLGSHDEVVLVQAFDLLRLEGHSRIAPAEADIRVMPLSFSQFSRFGTNANASAKFLNVYVRSIRRASGIVMSGWRPVVTTALT